MFIKKIVYTFYQFSIKMYQANQDGNGCYFNTMKIYSSSRHSYAITQLHYKFQALTCDNRWIKNKYHGIYILMYFWRVHFELY